MTDNPDQAGALGYRELTSRGTPLGKVFAGLDLQSGASWTVTLSHELLEMLADPWIDWCAQGEDEKIYALDAGDAVEADRMGYEDPGSAGFGLRRSLLVAPTRADRVDFKGGREAARSRFRRLHVGVGRERRVDADRSAGPGLTCDSVGKQEAAAQPEKAEWRRIGRAFSSFLRQRTPSLVISTRVRAEVRAARTASEA